MSGVKDKSTITQAAHNKYMHKNFVATGFFINLQMGKIRESTPLIKQPTRKNNKNKTRKKKISIELQHSTNVVK